MITTFYIENSNLSANSSKTKTTLKNMNLTPHKETINNLNPLGQRIYFKPDHWRNFNYNNAIVTNDLILISENYQNGISRQDIISYLKQENSSLLTGFLLTMIWGHGFSEQGRADNRGPWKVSQMLSNIDNAILILENAKHHLGLDDLPSAHSSFDNMKRCRVNYFSKFLYFLGRSMGMTRYPLIFDSRVAKTIGQLTSTNPILFSILDIQPKQDPVAYNNYVTEIHNIANGLNLESEKIEFFLFKGI